MPVNQNSGEGKSKGLAVFLSIILPGLGHFYVGSIGKGITFVILSLIAWGLNASIVGAMLGIPMLIILFIWSAIDACKVIK